MKWPRGKCNGKKIIGFRILTFFRINAWYFRANWDIGQPYIRFGPFMVKFELTYDWRE